MSSFLVFLCCFSLDRFEKTKKKPRISGLFTSVPNLLD
ncbi:hypothetical protein B603_0820 [Chlamydia psittaci WC]|uniref:Uncharacterized protein n=1 Tax=Chlamydia psittaci 99DC5 TaxID=1112251 RepID=A0ABP2X4I3_CHLPS|nr:hypothetical protein B603_0820 [Chlamydia psittaci WC]AFS28321.1 hypothetical protein B712_0816 [Chlamydia psittaci NJ1]EPJ28695.1 hypothetical protein CP99DC5_0146 [Chlamydia psittaci 99DC5]EPP31291.1 hypothetical protein CPC197_0945 [Chlamydia psittaci C1/97]